MGRLRTVSFLVANLLASPAWAGPVAPLALASPPPPSEELLLNAVDELRAGRSSKAIDVLETLLERQPNFRLARLLYADLLAARSGVRGIMADEQDPRVKELLDEARLRWDQSQAAPEAGMVPASVLQLSREYPYLVLVDLPSSRLHLMRNVDGELRSLGSRYASIGRGGIGKQSQGDLRTPVGLYHITGWIGDTALPELYGAGALPLNYPNLWDRQQSKTGHGIWLHGVPRDTYVRAPLSSEGCVTLANEDVLWLKPYVTANNAPVLLADKLDWIPQSKARAERDAFLARFETWRQNWIKMNLDGYLSFYAEDFTTAGMDKARFAEHKRRVDAGKTFASAKISDLSLFRYPGEAMLLAEFTVDYNSDQYRLVSRKEQYWRPDSKGNWKIFREEER